MLTVSHNSIMKMYYLKLAPVISLSPQLPAGSSSTTNTSGSVIAATAAASVSTTSALAVSTNTTILTAPSTGTDDDPATKNASVISTAGPINTTTANKASLPLIVKSSGPSRSQPAATGASNNNTNSSPKSKSGISNSSSECSSPSIKTPRQRHHQLQIVPSRDAASSNHQLFLSSQDLASAPNASSGVSSGGGSVAAARLLDLGKRLIEATREGQINTVRELVVDQAAPFTSDWLGTTALHVAAQNGFVEIAGILITGGVNRDAKTKLDRTALHFAAQSGSVDIVDMLISAGADVDARDMLRMTPLHWAVERGHFSVVERLLIAGANLSNKSKFQLTPIDIARNSEQYDVIELFNNWMSTNGGGSGGDSFGIYRNSSSCIPTNLSQHSQQQQQPQNQHYEQQIHHQMNLNFSPDLNQLFNLSTGFCTGDQSTLLTQTMGSGLSASGSAKTNLFKSHHITMVANSSTTSSGIPLDQQNESRDILDWDYQLALIDSANSSMNRNSTINWNEASGERSCNEEVGSGGGAASSSPDDDDKCIDLVEMELNGLEFTPELFMSSGDDGDESEPNIEYLMKIVAKLEKENKQLRQQVEQLSTTTS